jgi:transposase
VDTPSFEGYVEQILVPELHPKDVVVRDNLRPLQSAEARRTIARAGAESVPLPPYSPDLNPIEEMYSKVKEALRAAGARSVTTIYGARDRALRLVHHQDILGWFRSWGLCARQM